MGFFDLPTVKRTPNGILAIILCVVAGGLGTIIVGAIDDRGNDKKNIILVGALQLVGTLLLGAGWIWAIVWGVMVFMRSSDSPSSAPAVSEAAVQTAPAPAVAPAAPKAAAKKAPAKKSAPKKAAAKKSAKKA
ncbi:MAG TPA: hypothetical protein VM327_10695 [Candidatus Thermoplasmatota archaeon]|nr:hypothetical protein [Candidatus Thermoplasmatota archaeon]